MPWSSRSTPRSSYNHLAVVNFEYISEVVLDKGRGPLGLGSQHGLLGDFSINRCLSILPLDIHLYQFRTVSQSRLWENTITLTGAHYTGKQTGGTAELFCPSILPPECSSILTTQLYRRSLYSARNP